MRIGVFDRGAGIVLVVSGELDWCSAPRLDRELERVWQSEVEIVILDLRGVEFLDSSGLACVILADRHARQRGRRLGIVEGGRVRELLERWRVSGMLRLAATPEALLGSDRP